MAKKNNISIDPKKLKEAQRSLKRIERKIAPFSKPKEFSTVQRNEEWVESSTLLVIKK